MGDPLTDPRAQQLLNLDPGEVDTLAGHFGTVAGKASSARAGLQGAHGDLTWTGASADAFRSKLGKLPGDLSTVEQSHSDAAAALRTYAAQVEPIKTQFTAVYNSLQTAQGNLTTAQGNLSNAKSTLSTTQSAKHPSHSDVTSAKSAVSSAQSSVSNLQGEVSGLSSRGCHLLDEFDTLRDHCKSAVSDAASKAPQHHSSLFGSICHFVADVGHFFAKAGEGIAKSFKNVFDGHDFIEFIEHPSWSTFGQMCGDLAVVAGTIAAVVAPFAAPELLAADGAAEGAEAAVDGAAGAAEGAAEGGAEGAAEGAAGAGDGAADGAGESTNAFTKGATYANKYGGNVAKYAGDAQIGSEVAQGHYKDALVDATFQHVGIADKAADHLGIGEDAAEEAKSTATSTQHYADLRDVGLSDGAAKRLIYGDDVPSTFAGRTPTAEEIQTTLQNQVTEANQAASRALHVGQPVSAILDKVAVDPLKDKVKEAVGPEPTGAAG